jgi:hypothetical protein
MKKLSELNGKHCGFNEVFRSNQQNDKCNQQQVK